METKSKSDITGKIDNCIICGIDARAIKRSYINLKEPSHRGNPLKVVLSLVEELGIGQHELFHAGQLCQQCSRSLRRVREGREELEKFHAKYHETKAMLRSKRPQVISPDGQKLVEDIDNRKTMVVFNQVSATLSPEVASRLQGNTVAEKLHSFSGLMRTLGEDLSANQLWSYKGTVQVVADWDVFCRLQAVLHTWMAMQTNVKIEHDRDEENVDTKDEICAVNAGNESIKVQNSEMGGFGENEMVLAETDIQCDLAMTVDEVGEIGSNKNPNETVLGKALSHLDAPKIEDSAFDITEVCEYGQTQMSPDAPQSDTLVNHNQEPQYSCKSLEEPGDGDFNPTDKETIICSDSDTESGANGKEGTVSAKSKPGGQSDLNKVRKRYPKCKICKEIYTSKAGSKYHMIKHHLSQYLYRVQNRFLVKPPSNKQCCPDCFLLFDNMLLLEQHFGEFHMNNDQPIDNMTAEKGFQCSVCCYFYADRKQLREHCERAHWAKQFGCSLCKRAFGTKNNLKRHIRLCHEMTKLPCHICGVLRKGNRSMKRHIEIMHEGKPTQRRAPQHLCGICGKQFWSKGELSDHINMHNGMKAYKCATCGAEFYRRYCLSTHIRLKHKTEKGASSCLTGSCGNAFETRNQLTGSRKIFKANKCQQCGKLFSKKYCLDRHTRVHTGVKPYPCTFCDNAFIDYSTLRKHLLCVHKSNDRSLCRKRDTVQHSDVP